MLNDREAENLAPEEGAEFTEEQAVDRPEWLPEKFNSPEALAQSYSELEKAFHGKKEDIEAAIREQIASEIPEGIPETPGDYAFPESLDVDEDAFNESELATWWRETCHAARLPQEAFNEGLETYARAMMGPDPAVEMQALGENAQARISAVAAWADTNVSDEGEYAALQRMAQTASGIQLLEKMMGGSTTGASISSSDGQPTLTVEELIEAQNDERYWNPNKRDPSFVKKVDEMNARYYKNR
jgi:hypothetical protein